MNRGAQVALIVGLGVMGALAGVCASLFVVGPGPLLRTELGQRIVETVAGAGAPPLPAGVTVTPRGEVAPDFVFTARDGAQRRLSEFRGRPVLINYWASWCGPCVDEMPLLDAFAASQPPDGVQVLGVALDDPDSVAAFLAEAPVAFTILLDEPGPGDSSVRLGNRRSVLPFSVLLDADGRVMKTKLGAFDAERLEAWAAP
ncbi:TlpA disulfide reductase family protein [Chiayiivirga flava]|uniref:Thiol-disulfide isomerase/thioredoxin n=1 Tax=Chiayiivirga flava TaxID=659595 RepID=A0A7W8D872_9GAMM|nr:thiol-disulfide isomerase/thioredoxin [Chiayiivirga flava]